MYGLYFLTLCSVLRVFFFNQMTEIWIEDMPYVDRVYKLCLDLYICRETKNLDSEEDLFAKLIFVMRSRETCINLTRMPASAYFPQLVRHRSRRSQRESKQS